MGVAFVLRRRSEGYGRPLKWANIQHRKGRQDAARSKLFSKLAKEITVASFENSLERAAS